MKAQGLLENRRFILVAILMLVLAVVILIAKILVAEQQQLVTLINDAASVLCALIASVLFLRVWLSTGDKDISKKIWGQVALGMVLWTVAEGIWAFYEVILGIETPYPSVADLFWLVGYIPLYLALLTRYRIFQTAPTRQQKLLITFFVILFSMVSFVYVFRPIFASFDPARLAESLLNITYPLADLALLILTLVIIFSLEEGRFAFTWRLFGFGLLVVSAADLLFSYTTWNEIYYPEGRLNTITLVVDTLYNVSYLMLGLAIYAYGLISELQQAARMNIVLRSLTKSNILVFADAQGKILSLSDNFLNLIHSQVKSRYIKMPLSEALGIDVIVVENLIRKTAEQGSLSTQPLVVKDVNGGSKDVWLTSFAMYDAQNQFSSVALVLRANLALEGENEAPLEQDQKMLIDYYLTKAGTHRREENQVIKTYFLEQINLLYSLIHQFSGTQVAEKLLAHLRQVASQNNWQFTFTGQDIGIPEEYEGQTLADRLSTLLQEAKNFAVNMTNLKVVEQEIKNLDRNLSADTLQYIDKYDLRGTMRPVF